MTGAEMQRIRLTLGLSLVELADWLGFARSVRVSGEGGRRPGDQGAKRVMEMEADRRPISGPVARCMEAFDAGWRPGEADPNRALKRMVQTVQGLCVEQRCAVDAAKAHIAAENALEASLATGKATGLARACDVMSRVLRELVDAE